MSEYVGTVFQKSCEKMDEIPDGVVQTCVTSPPYFGLRDYGTATWEGGDAACDHDDVRRWEGEKQTQGAQSGHSSAAARLARKECKCGARRVDDQIGLEDTLEEYITRLVGVFREVRRVLRDDGTLWLNLGDSYCSTDKWGGGAENPGKHTVAANGDVPSWAVRAKKAKQPGLKPKDLMMVPARVALALQADGWYLRSDIIWHKPNPMPSSVTDRCTSSHEHVFMLSKQARYFYDADAIREQMSDASIDRYAFAFGGAKNERLKVTDNPTAFVGTREVTNGANKRDVWTIATTPYSDAHFATFPSELPALCIRAGSKPGDLVLDPFMGSGTTAMVAESLGRKWTGYEISAGYHALITERTRQTGLFGDGA